MLKKILRKNRLTSSLLEVYFLYKKYLKQKGWLESRYKHKPIDHNGKPLPWFTYASIHFIKQKLYLKPMKVFEYGSGNSTLWFSSKVKSIISIENDSNFYYKMLKKFSSKNNIIYELKKLNTNYSTKILDYENEFDIVIIDGRERVECTKNCIKALKKDGIIIFDNSDRVKYKEAYNFLSDLNFKNIEFKGHGPISHTEWQTTIYYREDNCFKI